VINLVNVDVTSYVMANMAKKVILANKLWALSISSSRTLVIMLG
jgi:hypothetical protein